RSQHRFPTASNTEAAQAVPRTRGILPPFCPSLRFLTSPALRSYTEKKTRHDIQQLRTTDTGLQFRDIPLPNGRTLLCDTSTNRLHPLVPLDMCRQLFQSLCSSSHPGIRATQRFVRQRYVWSSINSDVRRWTKVYTACRRSKIQRHT
ncbi:putative Integrase zinc binding domain-containing protein 3, partial [Homarus americanus]